MFHVGKMGWGSCKHLWLFKIHHVVWDYNTTYKIVMGYSPFCLTYGMETILSIELKVMTLCIATMMKLPLDES
jgi:hypothetical protein